MQLVIDHNRYVRECKHNLQRNIICVDRKRKIVEPYGRTLVAQINQSLLNDWFCGCK